MTFSLRSATDGPLVASAGGRSEGVVTEVSGVVIGFVFEERAFEDVVSVGTSLSVQLTEKIINAMKRRVPVFTMIDPNPAD